ncbi:hypothetical protein DAMA08_052920 [Martiniozyma asiatica (nom. inval.)]|nr:hypothetical protein DAMA08_052920 [Martiniozyma asiatica]
MGSDSDSDDPLGIVTVKRKLTPVKKNIKKPKVDILTLMRQKGQRDTLSGDLGFALDSSGFKSDRKFEKLERELLKRKENEKKVQSFLENDARVKKEEKNLTWQVENFLNNHLDKNFLNEFIEITKDNHKVSVLKHKNEIDNLRSKIYQSFKTKNPDLIPKKLKFFINEGITESSVYNFKIKDFDDFIKSSDVESVSLWKPSSGDILGSKSMAMYILASLGCDIDLINNPQEKFDARSALPSIDLQIYKFVKLLDSVLVDYSDFEFLSVVVKAQLLFLSDSELNKKIQTIEYQGQNLSGEELASYKLFEIAFMYPNDVYDIVRQFICDIKKQCFFTALTRLKTTFSPLVNASEQQFIISSLHFIFMCSIDTDDNIDYYYSTPRQTQFIEQFMNFVIQWSKHTLKDSAAPKLDLVLMRVQCLEKIFYMNKSNIIKSESIKLFRESLTKIRDVYFKHHYGNTTGYIPKCRLILDFIIGQMEEKTIADFFAV